MTRKEKILESMNRLEDRKPSEWIALSLLIKKFLFPLIRAELNGEPESQKIDIVEEAKKIFST